MREVLLLLERARPGISSQVVPHCDVKTHDLAKRLSKPVRRLPVLDQVVLRLNTAYDENVETTELQALADDLANHLTDKPVCQTSHLSRKSHFDIWSSPQRSRS